MAVGAIVPLAAAFLGKRTGNWKLWAPVAIAAALVGAVCMRVAFYNLGLSVFMFYWHPRPRLRGRRRPGEPPRRAHGRGLSPVHGDAHCFT